MNLPGPPLIYVITLGRATTDKQTWSTVLDTVRMAVDEGVDLIQIRERALSGRALFELALAAAEIRVGSPAKLLINDRSDIALAAGADGVHLTSTSLPSAVIRKCFPNGFMIGVSTHSADDVRVAAAGGADFAVFGPVFDSPGKGPEQGLGKLSEACASSQPFPVIALGGVDSTNCSFALQAGASGVAGIRSFNDLAELRAIMGKLEG